MARTKPHPKPELRHLHPAHRSSAPPTVSGRWLLTALAVSVPAAALCAWSVLCLLFWQGSWQLLYHPEATVSRTPASLGIAFSPVGFATNDTGAPQLSGWWLPAASARYTVLYLHGANGNLGDTVDDLSQLHSSGANVFAFDYRGYGQSLFVHPSETRWRQDTESALQYLTATRHIDPHSIVLYGNSLGANLALEVAATHPELAGVVLESPLDHPVNAVFADPRARLVPARLLVSDRYEVNTPAVALRIPSLWIFKDSPQTQTQPASDPAIAAAFQSVSAAKMRVSLNPASPQNQGAQTVPQALTRWLGDLHP